MKKILFILLLHTALACGAQTKTEREVSIKSESVPDNAIEWMKDAYEGVKKINWFEEHSEKGRSIEAKLKWEQKWHSVKFDTLGHIVDIEIETQLDDLPLHVQNAISTCLDSAFLRHNIQKVQIQYTGTSDDLEDLIDEKENDEITTRYEIEFFGKTEDESELWEGLFDHKGQLLKCRKIEVGSLDNLQY